MRVFLSEHKATLDRTLVYLRVVDIASIAKEFSVEVQQTPWAHEIGLCDPDGNRLRKGTRRTDLHTMLAPFPDWVSRASFR